MKPRKETRYVTRLTVFAPSIIGVIEGMRYDCCYPASEADSHKMEALINHHRRTPEDSVIQLIRVSRNQDEPTYARWKSFNTHIIDVRSVEDSPAEYTAEQACVMVKAGQVNKGGR